MLFKKISSFLIGYLSGSLSGAYIVGKILKRNVLKEFGDGHIGTSYTFKYLGTIPGLLVATIDFLKGFIPVSIFLKNNFSNFSIYLLCIGVVTGHNWNIFFGFQGGLGAASMYGILFALYPFFTVVSLLTGLFFLLFLKDTYKLTFIIISFLTIFLLVSKTNIVLSLIPFSLFGLMSYKIRILKNRESL